MVEMGLGKHQEWNFIAERKIKTTGLTLLPAKASLSDTVMQCRTAGFTAGWLVSPPTEPSFICWSPCAHSVLVFEVEMLEIIRFDEVIQVLPSTLMLEFISLQERTPEHAHLLSALEEGLLPRPNRRAAREEALPDLSLPAPWPWTSQLQISERNIYCFVTSLWCL